MSNLVDLATSSKNRNPARVRTRSRTFVIGGQKQTISAGAASQQKENKQSQTQNIIVETEPSEFYFDLKVYKACSDSDSQTHTWEPLDSPPQLDAGHLYRVRARTSINAGYFASESQHMEQWSLRVSSAIDLYLKPSKSIDALTFRNVQSTFKPEDEENKAFDHDYLLEVESDCPTDNLILELFYIENDIVKTVTRLPIALEGSYNEPDKKLWKRLGIDDSTRPPDSMALLHVEAVEQGKLRLSCWNMRPLALPNRPMFLEPIVLPKLGLEILNQSTNNPEAIQKIINKISDFSMLDIQQRIGQFSEWLSSLLKKYGEQTCIVIVDETASKLPWEMLEVEKGVYLGAHANVVRWTEAQYGSLRALLQLQEKEQHIGTVVAYVHDYDQTHVTEECSILTHLTHKIYTSEEELTPWLSPHELPQVGLVYLRCRGSFIYGNEPDEIIQILNNPYGEPVEIRLDDIDVPLEKRPVVFVNACHSACVLWDSNYSYGIVRILLAKLAAGYIGTMGPVEPNFAAQVAQDILRDARINAGMKLTEWLRRLRQQAIDRYKQNPKILEHKLALIYSFMYVYYGNPDTWLQLESALHEGLLQEGNND